MTTEKVIEGLKKLKSFHNGSYGNVCNEAIEALKLIAKYGGHEAVENAREKRIPKKPKIEGDGADAVFVCPCCYKLFDFVRLRNFINEFEFYRYCEDCGQAIDWEE